MIIKNIAIRFATWLRNRYTPSNIKTFYKEAGGIRYNSGKLRWRNIPLFMLRGLVQVGEYGEKKYATYNFLQGLPVSDTLDAMMRHIDSVTDPLQSDFDKESKVHHLYHVAWNALVAAWMIENKPNLDDRLKFTAHDKEAPTNAED